MRRRLAAIATGVALVLGTAGALTPAQSAVLCPPGCVSVGSIRVLGSGFPSENYLEMYGVINMAATTRTGGTANVADVAKTYNLYIWGYITPGANGTISGFVQFHADSGYYSEGSYDIYPDSFDASVKVTGTKKAMVMNGGKIQASLVAASGGFQGLFLSQA